MFRTLLTLLVTLPLLLPQGVCTCDFMRKCEACVDCAVNVQAQSSCCHQCQRHTVPKGEAVIVKAHGCHKSMPWEKQNSHQPCCPAKAGSAAWKAIPSPVDVNFCLVGLVNGLELPVAVSVAPAPLAYLRSADQPIYLTLHTLRI